MHTIQLNVHSAGRSLLFIEDRCVYVYIVIVMLSIICNAYMHCIDYDVYNDCAFSFSISAVDVWLQCVITAPSTSYSFLTQRQRVRESAISALTSLFLNTITKVRLIF